SRPRPAPARARPHRLNEDHKTSRGVTEKSSVMPPGTDQPTAEVVQKAFSTINIKVGDNSPVYVTAPVAVADKDATATIGSALAPQDQ
ncbi:hypothetical protein ABZ753_27685, partial [Streptomyces griseoincarnatus]